MPSIDVSEALTGGDIAGQLFTVIRRQEIVNEFGESVLQESRIEGVVGSVQFDGEGDLIREEADDAQNKTCTVITLFRLRGVTKGPAGTRYKPDQIVPSDGNIYEVVELGDWSPFGAGFTEAKCKTIPWLDKPPQNLAPRVGRLDFSMNSNSGLAHGAGGVA